MTDEAHHYDYPPIVRLQVMKAPSAGTNVLPILVSDTFCTVATMEIAALIESL